MSENEKQQCPEFPYFGASYPDARCIDGFLWDLDSYENGELFGGGDEPCPFCNEDSFIEHHVDELNGVKKGDVVAWIHRLKAKYI